MREVTLLPAATEIVAALCGFGVERARAELDALGDPHALELMGRVPTWIIDRNAYTSRPEPQVVDGVARIRSAIREQPAHDVESWQPVVC